MKKIKSFKSIRGYKKQVEKEHYDFNKYVHLGRWITYYYQVKETIGVISLLGKKSPKILEIGVGNKITASVLEGFGFDIKTMDIDPALKPDYVDSLPTPKNLKGKHFDCVICCEVLEHLKVKDVGLALKNIAKITDYAVISVPNKGISLSLTIKLWFFKHWTLFLASPTNFTKNKFNGEHYWELGGGNTSLDWLRKVVKNSGFTILKNYRLPENPDGRFLILKK